MGERAGEPGPSRAGATRAQRLLDGDARVRVGLVGAGPWARMVHAPMLAGHPGLALAGIWARRPEAASALAAETGSTAHATFDGLLARCDAVAFAVPPDVQAELAAKAAAAGKALLLEKPIALDLAAARRLVDAVDAAGICSQVVLTWRYSAEMRTFLADVARTRPIGGRGHFLSASALSGPFATPWRLEHGPLLDLGPHVVDALDAALGPVVGVRASGDRRRWVGLLLEHASGVVSEVSLTARSGAAVTRAGVEVHTEDEVLDFDGAAVYGPDVVATVASDWARTARGTAHPLDVHRGLHLQQVLHDAAGDLDARR
ncbi:MAG: Gfo/Idh/MocA family oxidoreductase [Actinobacteria bacterium]|nr:Gfo/Idh/MocA family oxidoreductase [Actinomycetota bacterium]